MIDSMPLWFSIPAVVSAWSLLIAVKVYEYHASNKVVS